MHTHTSMYIYIDVHMCVSVYHLSIHLPLSYLAPSSWILGFFSFFFPFAFQFKKFLLTHL